MDYAGVDIARGREGEYWVLEVNGIPAWKGLQQVSEIDLAQALAEDFARRKLARALEAAC
jgi:tetrahydromethanopterin:alpha-L-glutamate ligase